MPAGIIDQSAAQAILPHWVSDIQAGDDLVMVASSPSGWTNNELGLAWLEQVFDRYTKEKAGNRHRLLLLDGHGSHLTLEFLESCGANRILLAVLPPHSINTLQSLDVVMFKSLPSAYNLNLQNHIQASRGLVAIKKGNFYPLFKQARELNLTSVLVQINAIYFLTVNQSVKLYHITSIALRRPSTRALVTALQE